MRPIDHSSATAPLAALTSYQRAELRVVPMRDLEAELESIGTRAAELEFLLDHSGDSVAQEIQRLFGPTEDDTFLIADQETCDWRGAVLKAEISRRLALKVPLQGPRFSRDWVFDLKSRVDLPSFIVGQHDGTQLKRTGSHMVGLCPFHVEHTGSLHVWERHFHCFGCGNHGDVFDWLLQMAVRDWVEAVEYVAKWLGVPIPRSGESGTVLGMYDR